MRVLCLTLSLLAALATTAPAQAYTPARGSVEREQIMDAFRVPVARALGRSIIFHDVRMRAQNGWAFVWAVPRTPSGQKVIDEDAPGCVNCTDNVVGLLRWHDNRWTVVAYQIAPGEHPYEWQDRFPAPRGIFAWNWPS